MRSIADNLDAAFVASAALVCGQVSQVTGVPFPSPDARCALQQEVAAAEARLVEQELAPAVDWVLAAHSPSPRWQAGPASRRAQARFAELLQALPEAERPALLSSGGVGAQWLNVVPSEPLLEFPDEELRMALRWRLGLPLCEPGPCLRATQEGVCNGWRDAYGIHDSICPCGAGPTKRHDGVCTAHTQLANELTGISVQWKEPVRQWARVQPGQPDLAFRGLPASRLTYADVVCTLAAAHARSAVTAGVGAALWEVWKCTRYPVVDEAGRRCVPFDFVPLAFELHGRFGESARAFAQRLAWARSQMLGTEFAADVARAYGVISVSLMRHQACLLLGAPMPGQRRAPFSRRGGVSDLPLAGGLR